MSTRSNSIQIDLEDSDNSVGAIEIDSDSNGYSEQNANLSELPRQIKKLAFVNPGKFMDNFDPERSSREMRKVNRRIYRETVRKNQMYDDKGRMLVDSSDLCDCLEYACPGCHFPCQRCGSEKCGADCRCNRRWFYNEVEVEGTGRKISRDIAVQSQ